MSQMSKQYKADWYQRNKFRIKLETKAYRERNKERIRRKVAEYAAAHPTMVRENKKRWSKKNSAYYVAKCAERYAKQTRSTPFWANMFFISEAYRLAALRTKILGFKWDVDHIVPLRSKIVCGLHVENNLRVIPTVENQAKGNRHWPDMP